MFFCFNDGRYKINTFKSIFKPSMKCAKCENRLGLKRRRQCLTCSI